MPTPQAVQYPQASATFPVDQAFLRSTVGPKPKLTETVRERDARVARLVDRWRDSGGGRTERDRKAPMWEETDFVGRYHINKVPTAFPIPGHAVRHESRRAALQKAAAASFERLSDKTRDERIRSVQVRKTKDISVYNYYFTSTLRLVDMGEDLLDQTQAAVEAYVSEGKGKAWKASGKLNEAAAANIVSGKKRVVTQQEAEERILRDEAARTLEGGDPLAALQERLFGKKEVDAYGVTTVRVASRGKSRGGARPTTSPAEVAGAGASAAEARSEHKVEGMHQRRHQVARRVVERAQRIRPIAVRELKRPSDDSVGFRIHHLAALRMKMLEAERSNAAKRFEEKKDDSRLARLQRGEAAIG